MMPVTRSWLPYLALLSPAPHVLSLPGEGHVSGSSRCRRVGSASAVARGKLSQVCVLVLSHPVLSDSVTLWTVARVSSIHEVLQARILEWVATSYFRGSSWPRDWTCASYVSCICRRILYHRATREAPHRTGVSPVPLQTPGNRLCDCSNSSSGRWGSERLSL